MEEKKQLFQNMFEKYKSKIGNLTVPGQPGIFYFYSKRAAYEGDFDYLIAVSDINNYQLGNVLGGSIYPFQRWKISPISLGTYSTSSIYLNGETLDSLGDEAIYAVYPVKGPLTQLQAFQISLTLESAWKGYQYYESNALKYGFTRFSYPTYRSLYLKNKK